jgi:ferredoxin-NADP reductase
MDSAQKKELLEYLSDTMLKLADKSEQMQKIDINQLTFTSKTKTDRRMKIYLKLDKQGTEQFNFIKEAFKDIASSDDLMRQIFMRGLASISEEMKRALEEIKAKANAVMAEESSEKVEQMEASS